jgi:hypothetical protein
LQSRWQRIDGFHRERLDKGWEQMTALDDSSAKAP